MRLNSSGNLGLGVSPSSWGFAGNLDLGAGANIAFGSAGGTIASNAYYNSGWKYASNNYAVKYDQQQNSGAHYWYIAPSGTAGTAITFTQAMTLDASGNVGIGATSPGVKLDVNIGGTPASASAGTVARVVSAGGAGFDAIFGIVGGNAGRSIIDFGDTDSATPGRIAYEHNNNAFAFTTAATERMRLDSSGNFMVGKSSAVNKIETVGAGVDGNGVVSGVGITPSTIYTIKQSSTGALCVVFGDDGSNGFMDLVFFLATVTPQVITSKTMYGSPGGRTYSTTTTALKCSIGSGTQNIRTAVLSTLGT
jgi:hypothetical protein